MNRELTAQQIDAWWDERRAEEARNPPNYARAFELAKRSAEENRAKYVKENPAVILALGLDGELLPELTAMAIDREVKRRWPNKEWK